MDSKALDVENYAFSHAFSPFASLIYQISEAKSTVFFIFFYPYFFPIINFMPTMMELLRDRLLTLLKLYVN